MSTDMTLQINSTSSENTERLGEQLGQQLRGGEVIELVSDLGGGKTTLVHGLAKGIGSNDKVASPTFTISRLYKSDNLNLHHFDFYRLLDAGLMAHELHDALEDSKAATIVEWGDVVQKVLPNNRVTISFTATNDHLREITINYPESLKYLVENL